MTINRLIQTGDFDKAIRLAYLLPFHISDLALSRIAIALKNKDSDRAIELTTFIFNKKLKMQTKHTISLDSYHIYPQTPPI